jgi:hypothetical protein
MKISTKAQYSHLTTALLNAGYTTDTVYEALEAAGFSAEIEDNLYEGIYVSRVIAMMHEASEAKPKPQRKALKL